jgi:hypothetical protein
MWTTPDGYTLLLPRSGLTRIISRLQDSGLNGLVSDDFRGNIVDGIVSSIGKLAKNARRTGNVSHAKSQKKYPIFMAPAHGGKYLLLTQPLTNRQNAIIFVRFDPGLAEANGNGKTSAPPKSRYHPNVLKSTEALRREARNIFFKAYPRLKGKTEVLHRFPLEWRWLFPKADPNRLSNLQGVQLLAHRRKVTDTWDAFREAYRRRGKSPTPKEVLKHARLVDQSLFFPYSMKQIKSSHSGTATTPGNAVTLLSTSLPLEKAKTRRMKQCPTESSGRRKHLKISTRS